MQRPTCNQQLATQDKNPHARAGRPTRDLRQRFLEFGAGVIVLASPFPRTVAGRHAAKQMIESGTSCGANYAEAQFAESRRDLIHKVLIAAKETRETLFWLEVSQLAGVTRSPKVAGLLEEGDQLARMLGASARTARENAEDPAPETHG